MFAKCMGRLFTCYFSWFTKFRVSWGNCVGSRTSLVNIYTWGLQPTPLIFLVFASWFQVELNLYRLHNCEKKNWKQAWTFCRLLPRHSVTMPRVCVSVFRRRRSSIPSVCVAYWNVPFSSGDLQVDAVFRLVMNASFFFWIHLAHNIVLLLWPYPVTSDRQTWNHQIL